MSKGDVMTIVIEALPTPDSSVPWEQILDYRSDPDSRGKFLALRNWMNEVAREGLTPLELEEKLEWLLFDYKRHLDLHKLKTQVSRLETIVITAAEVLENATKLNFGKLAKGLFSLRQQRIDMLESELTLPGSEVAYIFEANELFRR
jgi:hypothetical protein